MAFTLIETSESLAGCITRLAAAPAIAVDTEADSLHSYWHRTCLLQISCDDDDFVVDPLAVDPRPLASIFANPSIEKIMHAAENDVRVMKRDFDFRFAGLFDTMVAARVLAYPRWGLADLLRDAFGVELDKQYQRADWAQRPLPAAALRYAAEDTHYLPALRRKLGAELCQQHRVEEAEEEFARLAETPPAERGFDTDGFWRVKGAYDLDPAARPRLRELYRLRDELARQANRPPFRIMPDTALIALARAAPKTQAELDALPGVSPFLAQRYGRALLAAVQRGEGQPSLYAERSRPDDAVLARFEALRAWRNARAGQRKVEGDVIVSNNVLKALAATPPHDRTTLATSGLLGAWKLDAYADEILAVLNRLG